MEDTTMTEGMEASAQILQSFQHLAPLLGVKLDKDLELAPQSCPDEAPSKRRRAKGKRPTCETGRRDGILQPPRDGAPDGQNPGQARSTDRSGETRRHIHFLLQQSGAYRIPEVLDCGGGDVALPEPEPVDTMATLTPTAAPSAPEGSPCQTDTTGRGQAGLTAGPGGNDESGAPARPELPVPGMGQGSTQTGGLQPTPHLLEKDGPEHPGVTGDVHGAEPDPGLSCSATIRRDHSVAPPTEPEGRSGVLVDESALRLQHLGPHGSQSQGSQPTPIRTGKPAEQESRSEINQGARARARPLLRHRPIDLTKGL